MACTPRIKTLCSKCAKAASILTCRGCRKDFCYRHVAEHREELNTQMNEITIIHDQLQQTITEQQSQSNCHPLLKQIDTWEENSIEKIHQAADEAREKLLTVVDQHRTKVADALVLLIQELNKARIDDDYVETDLKQWTEKLDKLRIDLAAAHVIDFGQDNNGISLIPKISINDFSSDSFETWFGDIHITDHNKLILHGQTNQIATVYSKTAYSSGQHKCRFKIENLYTNQYLVFGIVSQDISSISLSLTQCGRALIQSSNYYHQNGIVLFSLNGSNNIIQINDILEFQIDCPRQTIRVINERTNYQENFNSNLSQCKLPWRMVIGLFHDGDCVRLC